MKLTEPNHSNECLKTKLPNQNCNGIIYLVREKGRREI